MGSSKVQLTEVVEAPGAEAGAKTLQSRVLTLMGASRPAWVRSLILALGIVIVLRIVLSAWGEWVLAASPPDDLEAQYSHMGMTLQQGGLAAPWQREDALWYEKIATQGYGPSDGTTVFPPLMPLLMRLASVFTFGNVALAGLLVAALMTVVSFAVLYRLAALDLPENMAHMSVFYLALFPTAFFLLSAYSEPLFLLLVVGAFYFARQGRWPLVAVLALLAGLTRVQGAFLCLPLAAEYLSQLEWKLPALRRKWAQLLVVCAAAPLGVLAFLAYTQYVVGATLTWSEQQAALWHQQVTWPGEVLSKSVQSFFAPNALAINRFDLTIFALFTVLTVASFRLRLSYGLYAATILLPSLLHVHPEFPLMSFTRFALVAFPCFIALAAWSARTSRPHLAHTAILALWVVLLLFWSGQFVQAHWVA